MSDRFLLCLALLGLYLGPPPTPDPGTAPVYRILVNASNPISALSRADASSYFLKRKTRWPNGVAVAPVDLSSTSPFRTAFCREVLGKSSAEVMHYWQQRIFSGADTPPPVKSSEQEVIAFVQSNPGGIGYLPATTPLPKEVKSVTISDPSTQ